MSHFKVRPHVCGRPYVIISEYELIKNIINDLLLMTHKILAVLWEKISKLYLLKCICSGTECNWKNDHTSWWSIPHHDYVEDVQASCLAGCDVGINTNTNGLMFTTNSGKQKEQTWRQAKYHVRCEGTSDFNDWYVLISILSLL